ncbi:MAG: diguanylate cyclase [Propionivibrio sp.]|uniref:response regulator n=1 Tax=Propionivibrio sp. TaxID=2212460 RepID=UPI001A477200|nr:response regulator [Propionivibrio sp.]MBL8414858.1 diguanylate cyclase [Propionivibrio sp.]
MKALIVEPSRMIRNVFVSLFSKNNISAIAVETATEALVSLEAEHVDFLCFSMQLKDMTGIDFFVQAKERGLIGKHPSVMLTSSNESVTAKAVSLGVTECFSKNEPSRFEAYVNHWAISSSERLNGEVLLVEDSKSQAAYLEKLLVALGLNATRVATGEECLDVIAKRKYDLVLVDYMLEGTMTGLGVIRGIRLLEGRTGKLPILAISSFDDVPRRIEMLRSGANDFVLKPVVPEEFQVRVSNLIQLRQALDYLEEQHSILYEMAMHDRLTSVFNRHYVNERAQILIRESKESGRPLTCVVMDIDYFKRVNDSYGHSMGDSVLVAVATVLSEHVGKNGIVARMGGEEFMVVLPGIDEFTGSGMAEKTREIIEDLEPCGLRVTASFGVAQLRPDETYENLFGRADSAMYEAKRAGRNQVVSAE